MHLGSHRNRTAPLEFYPSPPSGAMLSKTVPEKRGETPVFCLTAPRFPKNTDKDFTPRERHQTNTPPPGQKMRRWGQRTVVWPEGEILVRRGSASGTNGFFSRGLARLDSVKEKGWYYVKYIVLGGRNLIQPPAINASTNPLFLWLW